MAGDLAFRELRATARARRYLGRVPEAVKQCLVRALEDLKQKRLRMREHSEYPHLFTTIACDHEITAATTVEKTIVVVLDIQPLADEVP